MTANSLTVMLVDDDQEFREALKRRLAASGYSVLAFASGEDALLYATRASTPISYAFIDHILSPALLSQGSPEALDGLQTAAHLTAIDPSVCVVVFSGRADIPAALRRQARHAGVRRYLYKMNSLRIADLIEELGELRDLSSLAEKIHTQRQHLTTTLQGIPVGTIFIDREYFPWVASYDWRQVEEKIDLIAYPLHRLADSLLDDTYRRRLIDAAMTGREADGLSLCAVVPGSLKYLHTWARPVIDSHNRLLGCSVSVVDATKDATITQMPLRARLALIADATVSAGFDRVRLYRTSEDGKRLIGVAEAGGGLNLDSFAGYEILITDATHLAKDTEPRLWTFGEVDDITTLPLRQSSGYIAFPLWHQERFVGLVTVDREYSHRVTPLTARDILTLAPYAEETKRALIDAPSEEKGREISGIGLAAVWAKIDSCAGPREAMGIVLSAVKELAACDAAFMLVRQANEAVMVASVGDFPQYRPKRVPLNGEVWSIRSILTGLPLVVQDVREQPPELMLETKTWSSEAMNAFSEIRAFANFPLTLGDSLGTFGVLTVLARAPKHFTPDRLRALQALARVAGMAWIDLSRARDRQAAAQHAMALSTVHNLRQPTTALRGALTRILRQHDKGTLTAEGAAAAASDALAYVKRSEDIITDVLQYLNPREPRRSSIQFRCFIEQVVVEFLKSHPGIQIEIDAPLIAPTFPADPEQLRQVFEELFHNASRAMRDHGVLRVIESSAELPDETGRIQPAVRIHVDDEGPGISPEVIDNLFEPFVTTSAVGAGLGLSFVRRIVEDHHGHVWHEPIEPTGTRFILVFPRRAEEDTYDG